MTPEERIAALEADLLDAKELLRLWLEDPDAEPERLGVRTAAIVLTRDEKAHLADLCGKFAKRPTLANAEALEKQAEYWSLPVSDLLDDDELYGVFADLTEPLAARPWDAVKDWRTTLSAASVWATSTPTGTTPVATIGAMPSPTGLTGISVMRAEPPVEVTVAQIDDDFTRDQVTVRVQKTVDGRVRTNTQKMRLGLLKRSDGLPNLASMARAMARSIDEDRTESTTAQISAEITNWLHKQADRALEAELATGE